MLFNLTAFSLIVDALMKSETYRNALNFWSFYFDKSLKNFYDQ